MLNWHVSLTGKQPLYQNAKLTNIKGCISVFHIIDKGEGKRESDFSIVLCLSTIEN